MALLDWIDFGRVSAERDQTLQKYFFDNGVLQKVVGNEHHFLILGRKGAGKTALFKYFIGHASQFIGSKNIISSISFDDYNWNIHALLSDDSKPAATVYKQSWKFIFFVEVLRVYDEWATREGVQKTKSFQIAERLLRKLFDNVLPTTLQLIGEKLLKLSKLKLPSGALDIGDKQIDAVSIEGGELGFEEYKSDKSLQDVLSRNVQNITRLCESALTDIPKGWPSVFICIDRVDEAWDAASFVLSSKVISGLISACESINSDFSPHVRPILFLREDIFDVLDVNDKNKLRADCGALLHWSTETIFAMLLKRVNFFGDGHLEKPVTEFDMLFDRAEMRQRAKPKKYILQRTMMRPRDLIHLMNLTADVMKQKQNNLFEDVDVDSEHLECHAVYEAEARYSAWLREELLDEWKTQKPIIHDLLNAIQNYGSTLINERKLQEAMNNLGHTIELPAAKEHIRFLFEISVIAVKVGESTQWKFKCFYPSQGFVTCSDYKVHDGLVKALTLTEPRPT